MRNDLGMAVPPEVVLSSSPHSRIPAHHSPLRAEITPAIPTIAAAPSSVVTGCSAAVV